MTRYEFATAIYRAILRGVVVQFGMLHLAVTRDYRGF